MTVIKNEEDRKELVGLISEAFQDVMVPALDDTREKILDELGGKIDSLERKFDALQDRLDRHHERIKKLEEIHPQYKHGAQA